MNVIYEPTGKAREYAPLSANLYRGCVHACRYCYAPEILRMDLETFAKDGTPRRGILKALEKDCIKFAGDPRPVLLSFTSDPYQPDEERNWITRRAIQIIGDAGLSIKVLTKNGALALRDIDLFERYKVEVGVTMIFLQDKFRKEWEPRAGDLASRSELLRQCHARRIRTWVSVEPVIDAKEALDLIYYFSCSGIVDTFKVGKLNHHPDLEAKVDWPEFLHRALQILVPSGKSYYIKNDLWHLASDVTRETFRKSSESSGLQCRKP